VTYPDPDHSVQEVGYRIMGISNINSVLIISHVYHSETIRIIQCPTSNQTRAILL